MLGSHPPELPVRVLVRLAETFAIAEGTARVALSRLSAEGDVVSDGGTYRLSERHRARQERQDAALRPPTRPWDGRWELLSSAGGAGGSAGGDEPAVAAGRRMARLRPGLWIRPDNLTIDPPLLEAGTTLWVAAVAAGSVPAASDLWDLDGWATSAHALVSDLGRAQAPPARLAVAAAMVRHIGLDPLLPAELLPAGWPGAELRAGYDAYRTELGQLIGALRDA